jgi:glyoxylase-like metal-dependent hydrolase (beta-lactamase superfamily II)
MLSPRRAISVNLSRLGSFGHRALSQQTNLKHRTKRTLICGVNMEITVLPLNSDNYGYILRRPGSSEAAVVDVSSQPDLILDTAAAMGVHINTVLTTHKHWDHAGGNKVMLERIPGVVFFPLNSSM